jgi:hypothetical protein
MPAHSLSLSLSLYLSLSIRLNISAKAVVFIYQAALLYLIAHRPTDDINVMKGRRAAPLFAHTWAGVEMYRVIRKSMPDFNTA